MIKLIPDNVAYASRSSGRVNRMPDGAHFSKAISSTAMIKILRFYAFILVTLIFAFSQNIRASEHVPAVKPNGWIFEGYSGLLKSYLQTQAALAANKKLSPYVYVYSDRSSHCRAIRAMMKRKDMIDAFSGTQIVMLNYFDLRRSKIINQSHRSSFTPMIVRISEAGDLIGEVMYPEIYLYNPLQTKEPELEKYTIINKWSGPIPKSVFARMLSKYFKKNNDF